MCRVTGSGWKRNRTVHIENTAQNPQPQLTLLTRLAFSAGIGFFLLCVTSLLSAQDADLQKVLGQMDSAAASFHTTQANFEWEQYWKVVNDKESQKGTVYYRRAGKEIQMMADITDPPKSVLFSEGKVQVYEPKLKRVTSYDAGKNREAV